METMTQINLPYALRIGAGNTQPIQQLELSNIDVSKRSMKMWSSVYTVRARMKSIICSWRIRRISDFIIQYIKLLCGKTEISYLGNQYSQGEELAGKYLNVDSARNMLQISIMKQHMETMIRCSSPQNLCTEIR